MIYEFNETFKMEEHFTNPWQQSPIEDKNRFGNERDELFRDKEQHKQHALAKGLKTHEKRG